MLGEALMNRAASLRHAGRCDEAESIATEVLASAPPTSSAASSAHGERGRCALADDRIDVAALEFGLALGLAEARGDGPIDRLPLQADFARALAIRSPDEARRVAEAALAVIDHTGVRPSLRAQLESLRAR